MGEAEAIAFAADIVAGVVKIAPTVLDLIRHGIDADPGSPVAVALAKVLPPESESDAEARRLRAQR